MIRSCFFKTQSNYTRENLKIILIKNNLHIKLRLSKSKNSQEISQFKFILFRDGVLISLKISELL